MNWLVRATKWVLGEIWEKLNIPELYRSLKELGFKYGRRFFWAALLWEIFEDLVCPLIAWQVGAPELIPLFLIFHFEPIAYPIIFWIFKTYDRVIGKEIQEPDRQWYSSNWRSLSKVLTYKLAISGWFGAILLHFNISLWVILVYTLLMAGFGFVHERIWHDSNYGIDDEDHVHFCRTFTKGITYRVVSSISMYSVLNYFMKDNIWVPLLTCQASGFILYLILESIWSKSDWGMEYSGGQNDLE